MESACGGRLTRPWGAETTRSTGDRFGSMLYARTEDADGAVAEAVGRVADAKGVPMAQVALAWVLAKPEVTAPIVGVSKMVQLDDALAALKVTLSSDELTAIEAPYIPHPVLGHS